MATGAILTIDQGTTNTKALLVDASGKTIARASRPMTVACPHPGWVEQDAAALWNSVREAIDECLEKSGGATPSAIGISNQRESVVVWNRATGAPAGPCVIWQCRRSAPFCAELRGRDLEPFIRSRTGLGIDPLFSASKIRWLIDNIPDGKQRAASGELCAGTVDSWVLWNLTGGAAHACDVTNASRTQLMNLRGLDWDAELLGLFDVPASMLAAIKPSSGLFGVTVQHGRLAAGVPVTAVIGDSHAALFAHACFRPGAVKATYGTGSSLMKRTAQPVESRHGLSTTVAWGRQAGAHYALEGNITTTGGAVQWVGELLGFDAATAQAATLAAGVDDTGGVYLVPALAGLGAPHWRDDARGLICGLTRGTTAAHLARAAIDAIAYQVADVFDAMEKDSGAAAPELLADGGASANDRLMQFQADILDRRVVRNLSSDLSALGAAYLAGLGAGVWRDENDLAGLERGEQSFEPRMAASDRRRLRQGWRQAVQRTLMVAT